MTRHSMNRVMSAIVGGAILISTQVCEASAQSSNAVTAKPSRSVTAGAETFSTFLEALPNPEVPAFTETQALGLVAMPLSCIDHPQARFDDNPVNYIFE